MSSKVTHFNITKYSVYKENQTWFHFPQRSDISINFLVDNNQPDEITITIMWRGTNLDKFKLFQSSKCLTSIFSKSPCIGVKQCDAYGRIIKRFQISLENDNDFQECCTKLKNEFKLYMGNMRSQDIGSTQSSQILSTCSMPIEFTYPTISPTLPMNIYQPLITTPNIQPPILPLQDIADLKKFTNNDLRAMIRETLQNPDFLDLVVRLDKIIED